MYRSITVVLHPTTRQRQALERLLELQREVYNAALEARRGAWRWEHRRVSRFEQYRELTELRAACPDVLDFGLTVCRGTLARLDEAFNGFYRRVEAGTKAGYPRFRGRGRWASVSWPDVKGWRFDKVHGAYRGKLYIQGVGHMALVGSRRHPDGTPKTLTVRRRGRRCEATVFVEIPDPKPSPSAGTSVGIDVGITVLCALVGTEGERRLVENQRPRKQQAERLSGAQADRAMRKRGSLRYRAASRRIAAVKRKEARIRADGLHELSATLVADYDVICVEDLRVASMIRSAKGTKDHPGKRVTQKSGLNDAISDASWARLFIMVAYKAEGAGRTLVKVPAAHTSTRCAKCGHAERANRISRAVFSCRRCGHNDHADLNAASNISRAGLALREAGLLPNEKLGSTCALRAS